MSAVPCKTKDVAVGPGDVADDADTPDYKHQPFPSHHATDVDFHIRVAILHPGQPDDPIHVTLCIKAFSKSDVPFYEVISYCWGPPEPSHRVFLDHSPDRPDEVSDACEGWYSIRQSLFLALRQFRYTDRDRFLWTDAICINQEDDAEKSVQVARMGDLYELANHVLVWLGPASDDSDRTLNILNDIGQQVDLDDGRWRFHVREGAINSTIADLRVPPNITEEDWIGVNSLLQREYFERLWVRQEIMLAAQEAVLVFCGSSSIPWTHFRAAFWCFFYKPRPSIPATRQLHSRFRVIQGLFDKKRSMGLQLLRALFQNCKCHNPRDRIYAVLRLLDRSISSSITPNYSKTTQQVYMDAVLACLNESSWCRSLDFLAECEYKSCWTPSWVPDWDVPLRYHSPSHFSSRSAWPFWPLIQYQMVESMLKVAGVSIGVINQLRPLNLESCTSDDQRTNLIREIVSDKQLSPTNTHCGSAIDNILRVLCHDQLADFVDFGTSNLEPCATLIEVRQVIMNLLDDRALETGLARREFWGKFVLQVRGACAGRVLFRLANGHVGSCPSGAQSGDEICAVLGCRVPLVLRPSGHGYVVVGAAFMARFAHGEAFLGPLEDDVRQVYRFDKDDIVFRPAPQCTDGWTYEDPRMRKLGIDLAQYREDLKTKAHSSHARLTVDLDTWRKAGVDVKMFDLV